MLLKKEFRKYLAEYIGTFSLVFCGTGAIVINELSNHTVSHLGVGITFGLIVMAMIYTFGQISGAHLNPAVSLAFWFSGRFSIKNLAPYIFSQLSGAVTASLILKFIFPDATELGITRPGGSLQQSFILETILTFILMLVIIHTATGAKEIGVFAGLGVGFTVMLEAIFAGPVSGASMNPARSFGPALASLDFNYLWLYLTAPVLGAILAVLTWKIIHDNEDQKEKSE